MRFVLGCLVNKVQYYWISDTYGEASYYWTRDIEQAGLLNSMSKADKQYKAVKKIVESKIANRKRPDFQSYRETDFAGEGLNGTDFKFNAEDIESIYLVEVGLIAYTVERDGSHINMEKFISKCGPEGVFETGTMLREFANKDAQDAVDSCCQL